MSLFDRLWKRVRPARPAGSEHARPRRGSVAIQVAITATVLIGMVSLGVEVSYLLLAHRQMQSAADAAALAGADALSAGNTTGITTEADAVAARNGFTNGVNNVVVTISNPPVGGAVDAGDSTAVEATVTQPQSLTLITLFHSGTISVSATAVAKVVSAGLYCSLSLDSSANAALSLSNSAQLLTNTNCGVAVNSSSASAITMTNSAIIGGPVLDHGGASLSNSAAFTNSSVTLYGGVTADPYANVALQTPPSCTSQSGTASNSQTLNLTQDSSLGTTFCSGWNFSNSATVNLAPGIYYVKQGLNISNSVTVNGTGGVTIVVYGTYAMSISNSVVLNLTAPTSGPYAGLAFFGPRNSTSNVTQALGSNSATLNITGAIYFPSQTLHLTNSASVGAPGCTQVIADVIIVSNSVTLDNNCTGTAVVPIGGSKTRLVQ
jgi:Flp pilus assembly protein TadG